jgi:hypothetical protein
LNRSRTPRIGERSAFPAAGLTYSLAPRHSERRSDGRGGELLLTLIEGKTVYRAQRMLFSEGRTAPFSVSEAARTLVLYQGDEEVRRTQLELRSTEVNVLRP